MNTGNLNIKYIIGNVFIAALVAWWASVLVQFANSSFGAFCMVGVAVFQGILLAIGWWYLMIKPEKIEEKKCVCTQPVSALLVGYKPIGILDNISSTSSDLKGTKYAVYSFDWEGHEMTVTSDLPYTGAAVRNIPSEIMVNPYNPDEIYEPQIERSRMAHYRFVGSSFIFWGFASFFFFFGED